MASFKLVERENWEVSFYCKDARGNNKKIKKRGFRTKKMLAIMLQIMLKSTLEI